jgi:hypothetical protein
MNNTIEVTPQEEELWNRKAKDTINPDHYKIGGIETIDYMEAKSSAEEFRGHLRLTAIKYLSRGPYKADALEDYKKARWYLDRLISTMETVKR